MAAPSPAAVFRKEIEAALAAGAEAEAMTLRLTYGDATHLRRDRSLAVSDISFSGGVMRFLGVRIEQGGVEKSCLERG
jgi:hypothetical protein